MSLRQTVRSVLIFAALMLIAGCGAGYTPSSPPPPATARFMFVANLFSNDISTYSVDSQSGQLTAKDTISAGGTHPRAIAAEPAGRFAYVGNLVSDDISVFTIDSNTGGLAMTGSTVPAGGGPRSIVVGPAGTVLYSVNQDSDTVSMFVINPTTGAISSLGSVPTDGAPVAIGFHPGGQFAYVANGFSNDLTIYGWTLPGDFGSSGRLQRAPIQVRLRCTRLEDLPMC